MTTAENTPLSKAERILEYWFGRVEETVLPSQNRREIWFAGTPEVDQEIRDNFADDLEKAIQGEYQAWEESPRSCLALIILLDQFSRNIYRGQAKAYEQDQKALDLVLRGIEREYDHSLSLVERAFFYMPFMHSESVEMQSTSVRAFKILVDLSFPEARSVFENFLDEAIRHFETIKTFGRFPGRNKALGRESTKEELEYLERLTTKPPE